MMVGNMHLDEKKNDAENEKRNIDIVVILLLRTGLIDMTALLLPNCCEENYIKGNKCEKLTGT